MFEGDDLELAHGHGPPGVGAAVAQNREEQDILANATTEPCTEWECAEDDDDGLNVGDGLNDDLYGDLESTIFERTSHRNLTTREDLEKRIAELEETMTKYVKERIELKTQIRTLKKENTLIHNNASSLYETAKFEVDRKNAMLTQMQTRLQEFAKKTGPNNYVSNEEVAEILQACREVALETGKSVSTDEMKRAIEEFKRKSDQKSRTRPMWSKKIHFNNMSIYYHSEQIPFNRLEKVTFTSRHHRSDSREGKSDPSTSLRTNSSRTYGRPENHIHIERERDREKSRNHYHYNNSRRESRGRSPGKRRRSRSLDRSHKRRSNSRTRNRGSDPERDRPSNSKSYKGTSSHRSSYKYDR